MITDADIKKMKKVFATKDDLKDLRSQVSDDLDGKLIKQKEEIIKEVAESVADTVVPMFDKCDKRLTRVERKIGLPTLVD